MAGKQDDLCRLHIEGSDAELASKVLMDFVAEHFMLVNTAHRSNKRANLSLLKGLSTFQLPFALHYQFARMEASTKANVLTKIAPLTSPQYSIEIEQGLLTRKACSSTATGQLITLPHLLSD